MLTIIYNSDLVSRMAQKQIRLEKEIYNDLKQAKRVFAFKVGIAALANSAIKIGLKQLIQTQPVKGK
jgi:hypothetical protein